MKKTFALPLEVKLTAEADNEEAALLQAKKFLKANLDLLKNDKKYNKEFRESIVSILGD